MKKLIAFSTILFVSLSGVLSPGLYAQDALEEIVVTARKRQENLSEIPLAITVFSAEDIEESGFKNLEDLSLQVAGFQHSAQGGQAPGRVNSQLRFRVMPLFRSNVLFKLIRVISLLIPYSYGSISGTLFRKLVLSGS